MPDSRPGAVRLRARKNCLDQKRRLIDRMCNRWRKANADCGRLMTEFDLIEPSGRWWKFRTRGRREQLRDIAETTAAIAASLALFTLQAWPFVSALAQ